MDEKSQKEELDLCEVPRWQQIKARLHNYNYPDFVSLAAKDKDSVIIDVRTPQEFQIEHIPGSTNLDYLSTDLADQLEGLQRGKNYYIYCRTGRRSLRVCVLLENMGFENVYNLEGGIASA